MHPVKTLEMTDHSIDKAGAIQNRIKNLKNSVSSFVINIVFEKDSFKYITT